MNLAIHIFRKDVRRFWPALLLVLALQTAYVYYQSLPGIPAAFSAGFNFTSENSPQLLTLFPAELGLSPVDLTMGLFLSGSALEAARRNPGTQLVFTTEHPMAHLQTEIQADNLRLSDYAVYIPVP